MLLRHESATDLMNELDPTKLNQVVLLVTSLQLFEALRDPRPEKIKAVLGEEATQYTRMVNALCRASREALNLKKYHDQHVKKEPEQPRKLDPNRELNENERGALLAAMERAMGFKAAPGPIGPNLNEYMAKHAHLNKGTANDRAHKAALAASSSHSTVSKPPPEKLPINDQAKAGNSSTTSNPSPNGSVHPEALTLDTGHETLDTAATSQPNSPTPSSENSKSAPPIIAHNSKVESPCEGETQADKPSTPGRCHNCRALLPPLLPSGERPSHWCPNCETSLRSPGSLIEYCPDCHECLPELRPDGKRPGPNCPTCNKKLPPPPLKTQ